MTSLGKNSPQKVVELVLGKLNSGEGGNRRHTPILVASGSNSIFGTLEETLIPLVFLLALLLILILSPPRVIPFLIYKLIPLKAGFFFGGLRQEFSSIHLYLTPWPQPNPHLEGKFDRQ